MVGVWFLADRTIGRAFGAVSRLSVIVCLSVMFCIAAAAKRYILAKNCLKEWIGNRGQKVHFLARRHISTSGFAATATETAVFALFLPVQPSNQYQMVEIDFLAANHVRIVGLCGQNWNWTLYYSFSLRSLRPRNVVEYLTTGAWPGDGRGLLWALATGHWALAVHSWQFIDWGTGVQLPGRLPDQFLKVWRSFVWLPYILWRNGTS